MTGDVGILFRIGTSSRPDASPRDVLPSDSTSSSVLTTGNVYYSALWADALSARASSTAAASTCMPPGCAAAGTTFVGVSLYGPRVGDPRHAQVRNPLAQEAWYVVELALLGAVEKCRRHSLRKQGVQRAPLRLAEVIAVAHVIAPARSTHKRRHLQMDTPSTQREGLPTFKAYGTSISTFHPSGRRGAACMSSTPALRAAPRTGARCASFVRALLARSPIARALNAR